MTRSVELKSRTGLLIGATLFFFLGVAGIFISLFLSVAFIKTDFGLMIDAGSTKSEIRVYQWVHRTQPTIPPLEEAPGGSSNPYSFRVEPGISAYVDNPAGLNESMIQLLEYALDTTPEKQYAYTPIYLKATAGMRLLDPSDQDQILNNIRVLFNEYPFRFEEDTWVEVITGQEEGVYSWLTVNHLTAKLEKADPKETFGALDLGGASTQITFIPEVSPTVDNFTLIMEKTQYDLFSKSYLGYGADQARYTYNQSLVEGSSEGLIDNPCLNIGFNESSAVFEFNNINYTMSGRSNYSECAKLVEQYLFNEEAFPRPSSPIHGHFFAFTGFVYTPEFLGLPEDASIEMIRQEGVKYCNLTWVQVLEKYPSTPSRFLANYCFNAAYIVTILETGYGFDANSRTQITFIEEVDGVSLDWTMGAMLYEANMLTILEEPTERLFKNFFGKVLILCSGVFFLAGIIVSIVYFKTQGQKIDEAQALLHHE